MTQALSCLTQKIELNYIIPAIRKEFIELLEKQNLNDSEIAKRLGITKAAVSQYKHGKRGKSINFPKGIAKEIEKSAKAITQGKSADVETTKIINKMKKNRDICIICKECQAK
jgi:predicted transcriptional regulator